MEIAQFAGWFLGYLLSGYLLVGVIGIWFFKNRPPIVKSAFLTGGFFLVLLISEFDRARPLQLTAMALGGLCIFLLYWRRLAKLRANKALPADHS